MQTPTPSNPLDVIRVPFILFSTALVGLVLLGPACSCDSDDLSTQAGDECDNDGDRMGNLTCEDGIWIEDDADVFDGDDDVFDDDADMSCDPESHREFCDRYQVECGSFSELDNCGAGRTVHCGALQGYQCTSPEICAHAADDEDRDTNQCVCFALDEDNPESEICTYADAECGTVDAGEFCQDWAEYGDVECGECDVDGVECGSDLPNICGCPCEIDGICYASGEADPDNECLVCDPNQSQDEFSTAADGALCENDGVCSDGECVCDDGMTDCDGQCVELTTNRNHCSECDISCEDDEICSAGECLEACGDDEVACSGECVDRSTDDDHCGECDLRCTTNVGGAESVCDDGSCTVQCIEEDDTMCDDVCANLQTDRDHCGGCDNDCGVTELCNEGTCQPFAGGACENNDECGIAQQCCTGECIPNAAQCPD